MRALVTLMLVGCAHAPVAPPRPLGDVFAVTSRPEIALVRMTPLADAPAADAPRRVVATAPPGSGPEQGVAVIVDQADGPPVTLSLLPYEGPPCVVTTSSRAAIGDGFTGVGSPQYTWTTGVAVSLPKDCTGIYSLAVLGERRGARLVRLDDVRSDASMEELASGDVHVRLRTQDGHETGDVEASRAAAKPVAFTRSGVFRAVVHDGDGVYVVVGSWDDHLLRAVQLR
jgi:hypothetical protein